MKKSLILFAIILCSAQVYGQKKKLDFFSEVGVSINRTSVKDSNTENRTGFGFGVYQSFRDSQKVDFLVGLEFHQTRQFKKNVYGGRFSSYNDVEYSYSWLSFPIFARINFGERIKYFGSFGIFGDVPLGASAKGTKQTSSYNENGELVVITSESKKIPVDVKSTFGGSLGAGAVIPVSTVRLVIKANYKFNALNISGDPMQSIRNNYFSVGVGMKL
ncbi:MAG: outer membrane beta-barrel protein [Cryomorphaceae bacterium]|nr:outer membrane beta-barrel protein [Flavobacteriales bacterium]